MKDIQFFNDTRLSVIDEISFTSYDEVLGGTSKNLQAFTQCQRHIYGKHGICFLGDFCQLDPIKRAPIYKHRNGIYWEQALNCMVELKGTHRFNDCEDMRTIMPNMRDGVLSADDRKMLNSRVINGKEVAQPNPFETKYATFYNLKRATVNAGIFQNYLNKHHKGKPESDIPLTAIVIKAKTSWNKSKDALSFC